MRVVDKNIERFAAHISQIEPLYQANHKGGDIDAMREMLFKASQENVSALVCGEFKRGKSSFINAFLGVDVCPVDAGIATSAVSIIKYGEKKKVTRYYGDINKLQTEEVSYEDIEKYAKGSSLEVENTVILEIEIPSERLKNGLMLMDTPGVGGLDARHLFLTLYVMPKADVTFFVVDASEPMSVTELDFLKDKVLKYSPSAKIILNKSDLIPKDQLSVMIHDMRNKIACHCGISQDSVDIIPVSSLLWKMCNEDKDEDLRASSNCDAIDNLLAMVVPSFKRTAMEELKTFMLSSLTSFKETLDFQLSQIEEPDEEAKKEFEARKAELINLKTNISNPNSEDRMKISRVIRTVKNEITSYLKQKTVLLTQDSLDQILKRPEAHGASSDDWILSQINMQLESIVTEIDHQITRGYSEINKIFGSDTSIVPYGGDGFTVRISDLTPTTRSFADKACTWVRTALPGVGIGGLIISICHAPLVVIAGVATGIAYAYHSIKGNDLQQRMSEIRRAVLPNISCLMTDLEAYVNKRFDDMENYLIEKIKSITEDAVEEMKVVMDNLKRINEDEKASKALKKKIEGDLLFVSSIKKSVELLLTNPFAK